MNYLVKVLATFQKYTLNRDMIKYGFINEENIQLVRDGLHLNEMSLGELNIMWHTVSDYFDTLYCEFDDNGEIKGFKPYSEQIEFYRDTKSAWLEVINAEARRIKKERGIV